MMKRLILALLLTLLGSPALGAAPPPGSVSTQVTIAVDGVSSGATTLIAVTVASMPSYSTRAQVRGSSDIWRLVPGTGATADGTTLVAASDGRQWVLEPSGALTFDTVTTLRAITAPLLSVGRLYKVRGYAGTGDGCQASYQWYPADTSADDGALVIKPTSVTTGRLKYDDVGNTQTFPLACSAIDHSGTTAQGQAIGALMTKLVAANFHTIDAGPPDRYKYNIADTLDIPPRASEGVPFTLKGGYWDGSAAALVGTMEALAYGEIGITGAGNGGNLLALGAPTARSFTQVVVAGDNTFPNVADIRNLVVGDTIQLRLGTEPSDASCQAFETYFSKVKTITPSGGNTGTIVIEGQIPETPPYPLPSWNINLCRGDGHNHDLIKVTGFQDETHIDDGVFNKVQIEGVYARNLIINKGFAPMCTICVNLWGTVGAKILDYHAKEVQSLGAGGPVDPGWFLATQQTYDTQISGLVVDNMHASGGVLNEEMSSRGTHFTGTTSVSVSTHGIVPGHVNLFTPSKGKGDVVADYVRLTGGGYSISAPGLFIKHLEVTGDNASDGTVSIQPTFIDGDGIDTMSFRGLRWNIKKQITMVLPKALIGGTTNYTIPVEGIPRNIRIYASSLTGVTGFFLHNTLDPGFGDSFLPELVPGGWGQPHNPRVPYYKGFSHFLQVTTNGSFNQDTYFVAEVEMWTRDAESATQTYTDNSKVRVKVSNGPPTANADWFGQQDFDYVNGAWYDTKAVGTGAADWVSRGGGSGINQLTGDGTAGPGSGSQAFALATTGCTASTFGSATASATVTYDAKGRCTAVTNTTISIPSTAISDSTVTGRAAIVATNAAALRTAAGEGTMSTQNASAVAITGGTITGMPTAVNPTDVVNLSLLQATAVGLQPKTAVRVATTGNGTLASAFANGQVVDSVTLATNDRILLWKQTTGSENGIYTVNASGAPTRATDADTGSKILNAVVQATAGATQTGFLFNCTTPATITINTTALTFVIFSQPVGMLLSANNLSDLANAGTARTNLGLGTLATQSGTFSGTSSGTNTGDQTNIAGNAATVTTNANSTGDVTSVGNATTLVNIPTTTTMAGKIIATAIAAPATPAAGKGNIYEDSTSKNLAIKNDAGTVNHGVQTKAAVASNWLTGIADDGSSTATQPSFTDITGTATNAQLANMTALTVKARVVNSTGAPSDLTCAAGSGGVVSEFGSALVCSTITSAGIGANQVTLPKLATQANNTIVGNNTGGVAAPIALTAAQVNTILGTGLLANPLSQFANTTSSQLLGIITDETGTGHVVFDTAPVFVSTVGMTEIAAPGTPGAGLLACWVDSTSANWACKNPGAVINHGIQTRAASANNWIRSIADDGSTTISQPAFTDISGSVTDAQHATMAALTVVANATNGTATPTDIAAVAASGAVLRESGSALSFGTIATAGIANNAVDNTKTAQMATLTIKGNNTGGTANAIDLTAAQVNSMLQTGHITSFQVLTTGTTYTRAAGVVSCMVEAWGGGGGGGGVAAAAAGQIAIAAGGGSGGYARRYYSACPSSGTIAIGAAGTAGNNAGAVAGNGGNTTFTDGTTLITASGGTGAPAGIGTGTTAVYLLGGAGAVISTNGDENDGGEPGGMASRVVNTGIANQGLSGYGAGRGGGIGRITTGAGNNALANSGAGGGGALALASGAAAVGGTGGGGRIIVWEMK